MDVQWEVAEAPRVGRPPAVRPEVFRHTLHIVQVADPHYGSLWWAYLDEPDKWRVCNVAVGHLLTMHARKILTKVAEWEARQRSGRNPNFVGGGNRPTVPTEWLARWSVLVALDRSEGEPEWSLRMLDEGAWEASGQRLEELMRKLVKRIEARASRGEATDVPVATIVSMEAEVPALVAEGERDESEPPARVVVEAEAPAVRVVAEGARGLRQVEAEEEPEARAAGFEAAILGLIGDAQNERAELCVQIRRMRRDLEAVDERIGAYRRTLEDGVRYLKAGAGLERRAG